jgi:hypothetical protein
MELVANLRDMGDSLRANAERLLRDVQSIHSRMVAQIDRAETKSGQPGGAAVAAAQRSRADAAGDGPPPRRQGRDRDVPPPPADGEVLDVPEFMPPS